MGGHHVDSWLVEAFCERAGFDLARFLDPSVAWWHRAMLEEACAVKERLFFHDDTHFLIEPPTSFKNFARQNFRTRSRLAVTI